MHRLLSSLLVVPLALAIIAGAQGAEKASVVGRQVDNFTLNDFRGTAHSLDDYADAKVVVVAFLGTECPLVKLYSARLAELANEYEAQGVQFLAINANRQDNITEIGAHARRHSIEFPVLKDLTNEVVDLFGATRTPEMFVLDQNRVIRYRGRVDDQYGFGLGVGYQKTELTRRDLTIAIDEVLAGEEVNVEETHTPGCLIGRTRTPNEQSEVTYTKHIAALFNHHCIQCHREGQIAPFALTEYEEVAGWADMIEEVVREQRMPPWHADPKFGVFENDISLSAEEKQLIYDWVANGAPQGDPADLRTQPREFVDGWQMPESPDVVIYMADEPYTVAANGTVEYQYFEVDPGFTEDKWVKFAESLPGNRAVVHHIIVFVNPPEGANTREIQSYGLLSGYAPGTRPFDYGDNMAKFVAAGSKLTFQLHYTPVGTEQQDRSMVGLVFADPDEVTHQVITANAPNAFFEIPAHADNFEVKSRTTFNQDVTMLSLFPHMHLRGKDFKYVARYPDGTEEVLLDVPHYDFNWQIYYNFVEPKVFPKGTKLLCTAHFDNSEGNLANPDPDDTVRWGDQSWEEMMIGWYDIAIPKGQKLVSRASARRSERRQRDGDNAEGGGGGR